MFVIINEIKRKDDVPREKLPVHGELLEVGVVEHQPTVGPVLSAVHIPFFIKN